MHLYYNLCMHETLILHNRQLYYFNNIYEKKMEIKEFNLLYVYDHV